MESYSLSQTEDTVDRTIDTTIPILSLNEDERNDGSIIREISPNADEIVPNSVESSFPDAVMKNDSIVHDSSINTDDVVRNLVDNTINEEPGSNDPIMYNNSLDTDDVVRDLVENSTEDTNISSKDDVLDTLLESIINDEPQNSDTIEDSRVSLDSSIADLPSTKSVSVPPSDRICQLPLGRVRTIVKADPDVNIVSADVTFLISKSCELFLQWLGKEMHSYTIQQKKKTIQKRDLDLAIRENPMLEFLDGALD